MSEEKLNPEAETEKVEVVSDDEVEVEGTEEAVDGNVENEQVIDEAPDPEKVLADAQQEVADMRDTMLRAAAENENFKKRVERERLASLKYAGEYIFKEMLPVVDNLERAIGQGVVDGVDAETNLAALIEGVELTLKSLTTTLEKFEVKPIDSAGQAFDPKLHEALTMEVSEAVPENHVVNVFEKGYFYKDRLLRAAKVTVSSGGGDKE